MQYSIFELTVAEENYLEPINKLLAQLTSTPLVLTIDELRALVENPSSSLFLLQCEGKVVGMLTLGSYLAPTGRKFWIEDVVVDSSMRGRSFGRKLVEHAIARAGEKGGGTLYLTSRPARVAANALYRSVGFVPKETNFYKMSVPAIED